MTKEINDLYSFDVKSKKWECIVEEEESCASPNKSKRGQTKQGGP